MLKSRKIVLSIILTVFLVGLLPGFCTNNVSANFENDIIVNQEEIRQGKVLFVKIDNQYNYNIEKVVFNKREYIVRTDRDSDQLVVVIPLSYWLSPGNYELEITEDNFKVNKEIKVLTGDFKESYITVKSSKEELVRPQKKETVVRKKKDSTLIAKAREESADERLWQGEFIWPVNGTISTSFGATRFVNGKLQSRHSGIDIAAPTGTKVNAAASGIVTLANDLLVTGKTIIIDHGWNLTSSYSHLNSISVEIGQRVHKGDIIGSVGSTGFSTGPHLHWTVKVDGVFVNPEQFTKGTL